MAAYFVQELELYFAFRRKDCAFWFKQEQVLAFGMMELVEVSLVREQWEVEKILKVFLMAFILEADSSVSVWLRFESPSDYS